MNYNATRAGKSKTRKNQINMPKPHARVQTMFKTSVKFQIKSPGNVAEVRHAGYLSAREISPKQKRECETFGFSITTHLNKSAKAPFFVR